MRGETGSFFDGFGKVSGYVFEASQVMFALSAGVGHFAMRYDPCWEPQ